MAEYIDRDAALRTAHIMRPEDKSLETEIANISAADVAPVVHGRFMHDGPRFVGGVDWWHCSNCGVLASGVELRFDYCPWCGARMNGDAE